MRMSEAGRKLLMQREGVRTKAYKDSVGVWTIGVGHTAAAGPPAPKAGMTITKAEALEILARDLVQYEDAVRTAVKVPVTQNQFDAMVSLCFNIGVGGFRKSSVVRRLNAGDVNGAANAFMMWVKPPELRGRREAERKQFLTPAAPHPMTKQTREAPVTRDELKAKGSRTIEAVDEGDIAAAAAQKAVLGGGVSTLGIDVLASQAHSIHETASSAVDTVERGRPVLEWAAAHWHWLAIILLTGLAVYFFWRAHAQHGRARRAFKRIEFARVDDANNGFHIGRAG